MGQYRVSNLFPNVERIKIKVIDTSAWAWNRLREFSLFPESETSFHFDCPMSKCLGHTSGITFRQVIAQMVSGRECHRQERLACGGYGGYNFTFHCDWYAVLDISITYRIP